MLASMLVTLGAAGLLFWLAAGDRTADDLPVRRAQLEMRRRKKQARRDRASVRGKGRQVRALRLVDELTAARYRGPDLARAYRSLRRHWRKMLDPYADLPPDKAFCRLKVAFRIPDVEGYLKRHRRPGRSRERLGAGERRWSYTHGVYESRVALFAPLAERRHKRSGRTRPRATKSRRVDRQGRLPKGARYSFDVHVPEKAALEFGVGVIPRSAQAASPTRFEIVVESEGTREVIWRQEVGRADQLTWLEDRVVLQRWAGRRIVLHLQTYGQGGAGLWLDPQMWAAGHGAGDNVLVILVDTLRPDGVGALGGKHARTPHMDSLVRRGTRLTRFFSNGSFTRNSLISFFSANYPSSVGLVADRFTFRAGSRRKFYAMRPPQLPHHLEQQGYAVGATINNFFAFPYVSVGVDQGFGFLTDVRHPTLDSPAITRAAIRFLRKNRRRRFFLFVHYETLHNYDKNTHALARRFPLPDDVEMNKYWRAYLELARQMDDEVGRLLAAVQELGLDRNTLIVLTADHGEVFDKAHDHFVPYYKMRMLHQHARSVWDEVLHVPMVWVRPGRIGANKKVAVQLRGIDLAPSILDYLELPPLEPVVGKSFWPLVHELRSSAKKNSAEKDRPVYAEGFHVRALRDAGHKYIRRDFATKRFVFAGHAYERPEELFDLKRDPRETTDVSAQKPRLLEAMRAKLDRIQEQSEYSKLSRRTKTESDGSPAGLHLRVCASKKPVVLAGIIRLQCKDSRVVVLGARGDVVCWPSGVSGSRGGEAMTFEIQGSAACPGIDWTTEPHCASHLELKRNGSQIAMHEVRAGPFGLGLLSSSRLGFSVAPLLVSPGPPAGLSAGRPGIYLWQDAWRGSTWVDPGAAERSKASQSMVKFNLQQGGYVKERKPR
jgi:arylsulfatase A-like enzyme